MNDDAFGWLVSRRLRLPVVFLCSLVAAQPLCAGIVTYIYDPLNRLTNAAYSDGSRESYFHDNAGNRLTRITVAPTVQSDTVAPAVPFNITAEEISSSEIRLSWNRTFDTGGSGLEGYLVYVNGAVTVNTTKRSVVLSGLLANTSYSITIAAYDRAGNISEPSESIAFFHLAPPSLRDPNLNNGMLGFTLHGAIGSNYVIEASSNLLNWESILTNITLASSTLPISDPDSTNHPQRFYRARLSANESPEPSNLIVNGSFEIPIPEMAATGSVGLSPGDTRLPSWTIGGTGGPVYCGTSGARAGDGTTCTTMSQKGCCVTVLYQPATF